MGIVSENCQAVRAAGGDSLYQAASEDDGMYPLGNWGREESLREPRAAYDTGTEHTVRKYKKRGSYTLEDYYAVPQEKRMELIDGVLYDMAAPSIIHQVLLGELLFQISSYIKEKAGASVREYWMIDPDKEKVVVYDLEGDELPQVYGFQERVPMAIFAGDAQVDFATIDAYIKGVKRV